MEIVELNLVIGWFCRDVAYVYRALRMIDGIADMNGFADSEGN